MTTEAVFRYLQIQNRPFNATDLASNLEKEKHGKAAIQKALDKLTENQKIFLKTYGKQKIYCISQEKSQAKDEIVNIERELQTQASEQENKFKELDKEFRDKQKILESLKGIMSFREAQDEYGRLKDSLAQLNDKITHKLQSTDDTEDLIEKKRKAEIDLSQYTKEFTKRKKICNNILDCILESYPGTKKQLYNDIGIEIITEKELNT